MFPFIASSSSVSQKSLLIVLEHYCHYEEVDWKFLVSELVAFAVNSFEELLEVSSHVYLCTQVEFIFGKLS